ncbi:MAG TPA: FHA domain-containing protein [Mycobacterium sp.]|jgi:hypothetical protein|nr:FHA domain-containing protein [Mycobacterium sp.]
MNSYTVAIAPGDGLVARTGDVVMYVGDTAGAADLLSALDSVAAAPSPGWALAKVLAAIALDPNSRLVPPFGVVAPTGDGLVLMLRGCVTADIQGDGASRTVAGDRAITWVDEVVREPVDKMVIGANISGLTAHALTDLRAGVVPGGGFVLQPVARSQPSAPSPAVSVEIEPEPRAAQAGLDQPATPAEQQPGAETPDPIGQNLQDSTALLKGSPRRSPETLPPATGPTSDRPVEASPRTPAAPTRTASAVLGALTTDDDAIYPLDRSYVIGRDPMVDKSVGEATASPIFLLDDQQISRVHAYVTINAGVVLVRDAGTPGGTFVASPGDREWTSVGDQPTELKPGSTLRIGERMLVYRN